MARFAAGTAVLDEQDPALWCPVTRGVAPTSCEPGLIIIARKKHDEDSPWIWNRYFYKRKAKKYTLKDFHFINDFASLHDDHRQRYYNDLETLAERLENATLERNSQSLVKLFGSRAASAGTKAEIDELETAVRQQQESPKTTFACKTSVAEWSIDEVTDKRDHIKGTIKAKVDGLLSSLDLGGAISHRQKSTVAASNIVMEKIVAHEGEMARATYDVDKVRSLFSPKGSTQTGAVRLQYVLAVAYATDCTVTYEHDRELQVDATQGFQDVAEAKISLQKTRSASGTSVYTATLADAKIPIAILPAYVKLRGTGKVQCEHWRNGLIKTNSAGAGSNEAVQEGGVNTEADRELTFDVLDVVIHDEKQKVAMLLQPAHLGQACLDLLELMALGFPFVGMEANNETKHFKHKQRASELVIESKWQSIDGEGYDPVISVDDQYFVWKLSDHVEGCPWNNELLESL